MRYDFPARVVLNGDRERAARFVGEARTLLGALVGDLAEAGIRSGARETSPQQGVHIRAVFDGTIGKMTITTAVTPTSQLSADSRTAIWIPHGFVLYPASAAAPAGWGFPIVQDEAPGQTPYTLANTDPGLDVTRWTVGGAFGEVLLTKYVAAGYPRSRALVAPLCFSRAAGPSVRATWQPPSAVVDDYAAFRPRVTGFSDPPSAGAATAETAAAASFKRGIFERVNAHRSDIGRDPLEQPFYGLYDSAQASADVSFLTHTLGHFSDRYPVTYRTPEDRMSKDGMRTINIVYSDPNSRNYNFGENALVVTTAPLEPLGVDPNGTGIYNVAAGGPDVTAQAAFDSWMASSGHRAAIESASYDRFGMAGTVTPIAMRHNYAVQQFVRNDQWIGCGNRMFECPDGLSPISWFGPPSMNLAWETWPAFLNTDVDEPIILLYANFGFFNDETSWLSYYMTTRDTDYRFAWSRAVYSAGRCIAYAPGLVWAAGVHKLDTGKYRLVVLTHNEADQPSDKLTNGMTPILRYYWCDMNAVGGAALSPESVVRGIYGDEDEGWPWDVVNFAYSWRGGEQVDVSSLFGDETDLLKYRSQWVFNATATKAACLRDYGPVVGPSTGHRGYQVYATAPFGSFSDGLYPATVELGFVHADAGVTHALSFRGPPTDPDVTVEQIAVDFEADDSLVYAYRVPDGTVVSNGAPPVGDTDPRRFRFSSASASAYFVVGTGPYEVVHSSELSNRYEITDPELSDWSKVHVLDVKRGVFLAERTVNTFCSVQTATPVVSVQTIIGGQHVRHTSMANPTNILVQQELCYSNESGSGAFMWVSTIAVSCLVQGYYARLGSDYIVGFVALPQPNTMRVLDSWPTPLGPCTTPGSGGCVPTIFDYLGAAHYMLPSELVHLGHFVTSSFADSEQLRALVGATGDEFRSIYARVV